MRILALILPILLLCTFASAPSSQAQQTPPDLARLLNEQEQKPNNARSNTQRQQQELRRFEVERERQWENICHCKGIARIVTERGQMERPMIDIVVTQRIKPGMEAQAEALFREVEKATLAKDKGCLRYEWYRAEEPGTYILLERWSDREAIQAHFKSDHMAQLLPKLVPYAVEKFASVRLSRLD